MEEKQKKRSDKEKNRVLIKIHSSNTWVRISPTMCLMKFLSEKRRRGLKRGADKWRLKAGK